MTKELTDDVASKLVIFALTWLTSLNNDYEIDLNLKDLLMDIETAIDKDNTLLNQNEKDFIYNLYLKDECTSLKEVSELLGYSSYWGGVIHANAINKIVKFLGIGGAKNS